MVGESAKLTCREEGEGLVEDRRMEEGGQPRARGVAVGVEGVITAALRRWTETVSVREPRRRVKK